MHFYCSDLIRCGFKKDCCSSCHTEDEEGYYSLLEKYSDDAGINDGPNTGMLSDYDGKGKHIVYLCCKETSFDDTNKSHWQKLIDQQEAASGSE